MTLNPFDPAELKAAFKAAAPDERASLLCQAAVQMADGLRGISAVTLLVDEDPGNFQRGLELALETNPKNLTAARALIWLSIRRRKFDDAEKYFRIIAESWPNHGDIYLEQLRNALIQEHSQKSIRFEAARRFLKSSAGLTSYSLQTALGEGNSDRIGELKLKLVDLGKIAFSNMLNADAVDFSKEERGRLWAISEMLADAKTIALVGNSPGLIGSGLGPVIDGHDMVIRCNFPEVDAYKDDVGGKVSMVFFNESIRAQIGKFKARSHAYDGVYSVGLHPEPNFNSGAPLDSIVSDGTTKIPAKTRTFLSDVCYARSTTGLMAINVLTFLYSKNFNAYGFDFFSNLAKPHYFGTQTGAYLGHELQYEGWYAKKFLQGVFGDQICFV